jgi:hypothetical protein
MKPVIDRVGQGCLVYKWADVQYLHLSNQEVRRTIVRTPVVHQLAFTYVVGVTMKYEGLYKAAPPYADGEIGELNDRKGTWLLEVKTDVYKQTLLVHPEDCQLVWEEITIEELEGIQHDLNTSGITPEQYAKGYELKFHDGRLREALLYEGYSQCPKCRKWNHESDGEICNQCAEKEEK